jgi:hypothetical protein
VCTKFSTYFHREQTGSPARRLVGWLMLFRDIIAAYSNNHMDHINTQVDKNIEILDVGAGDKILKLIKNFFFLPRCSHTWELAPAFGA